MNEISDLLERIDAPQTDVSADIARGERALRRRRRWQVSAVALSLAALAVAGAALQASSGVSGAAGTGVASQPSSSSHGQKAHTCVGAGCPTSEHQATNRPPTVKQRMREIESQMADPRTGATLRSYHDVLGEHLDPTGDKLRLAQNQQGGTGHFGTKLDWDGGGMLMISVSTSWRTSDWNAYPPRPGQQITFRGHPARVLVDGADVWVAVEHDDGQVVMLLATPSFGNNGTSIPATGLTAHQLLDAAADPRLQLPAYLQ